MPKSRSTTIDSDFEPAGAATSPTSRQIAQDATNAVVIGAIQAQPESALKRLRLRHDGRGRVTGICSTLHPRRQQFGTLPGGKG